MLGTDTAVYLAHVVHDKRLNYALCAVLKTFIIIARQDDVQVQIAVTYVTMPVRKNLSFFSLREFWAFSDELTSCVNDMVVVGSR